MKELLSALGASSVENPEDHENWAFFSAEFATPAGPVTGSYLYLKSKCPAKAATGQALQSWRLLANRRDYHVILPPSSDLARDLRQTALIFGAKSAQTKREFLRCQILANQDLREIINEPHFIAPDLTVGNETTPRPNAPQFLQNWFDPNKSKPFSNRVGILCAHAGSGKTTMSRHLAKQLHNKKTGVFPILIDSDQWNDLLTLRTSLSIIWEQAITRSIQRPGAILSNELLFKTLVKEGLFPIIFDGFDELCLHPNSCFSPEQVIEEVLDDLISSSEDDSSRVLFTTRESYWKTFSEKLNLERVDVFHLLGFSNNQKKTYFSARLGDNAIKIDLALRLSKQVATMAEIPNTTINAERISGTPFVLSLVAEACDVEDPELEAKNPYQGDQLEWLIKAICRRENHRQKLNIEPTKQIELFEELFHLFPEAISKSDLIEYTALVCGLNPSAVPPGLFSHFFLVTDDQGDFRPKYDVLRAYFIARYLAFGLCDTNRKPGSQDIAQIFAESIGGSTQVMDWAINIFSHFRKTKNNVYRAAVHRAVIILDNCEGKERKSGMTSLTQLVIRLLDQPTPEERTAELKFLLSPDVESLWKNVVFSEALRDLHFQNPHFVECSFSDCSLRSIRFGNAPVFERCRFEGSLDFGTCLDDLRPEFKECIISNEAAFEISRVTNTSPKLEIAQNLASEAIERALRKFKGRYGFETLMMANRLRGISPANPFRESVWDTLISVGLVEKHHISNVSEGGFHVSFDDSVRAEVWKFFDNGVFGPKLKAAFEQMIAKFK